MPASSCGPIIIIEHSAEAASASNWSGALRATEVREDEQITDALMVSLAVIMSNELANGDTCDFHCLLVCPATIFKP